jgi:hypothetical protein
MISNTETLQVALKALELPSLKTQAMLEQRDKAIARVQEALAQLEQEPYDQTALELCEVCCWKTLIPGDVCLNCERSAQPAQEPSQWRDMIIVSLVREGVNKHRARELADHFAAQRPWQGLTDDDWEWVADKKGTSQDTFDQGAAWAEAKLKERNT